MEGFVAGITSTFLTHPLDTLKSVGQVSSLKRNVLREMIQQGGFFKGVGLHCMAMGTFYGFFFPVYEHLKKENYPKFASSYLAGAVGTWFGTPLYTMKVRRQTESRSLSTPELVRLIYSERGIQGFWRGYASSLGRNLELGIQFPLFEYLRSEYQLPDFQAAFAAKLFSSSLTFPFDTIRTNQRSGNYGSFGQIARQIYQTDGIRGFWRGYTPYAIRSVPASAITLAVYGLFAK